MLHSALDLRCDGEAEATGLSVALELKLEVLVPARSEFTGSPIIIRLVMT